MDLFSQPFQFRFGKKDVARSTTLGSLSSTLVIVLSLAYLAYLIYAYLTGAFSPTVVVTQNSVTMVNQTLEYSPIMFKFNLPPSITEDEQASYFRFYAQMGVGTTDGSNLTLVKCMNIKKNAKFTNYLCLDPSTIDQLYVDDNGGFNQIYVRVWQCTGAENNCKSSTVIQSAMSDRDFSIEVLLAYEEYNANTGLVDLKYQKKNIPGDLTVVSWQVIELKQTTLSVDKGFLVASWEIFNFISDFNSDIIPMMQGYMQIKYGLKAPVFMQFEIRMALSNQSIVVQWIKLGALIAMFTAIFSTLLNLGILGKMSSNAMIYQEMVDNFLQEYYRETAIDLQNKQLEHDKEFMEKVKGMSEHDHKILKDKKIQENLLKADGELQAIKAFLSVGSEKPSTTKVRGVDKAEHLEKEEVHRRIWRRLPDLMNARLLYNEIYQLKTAVQLLYSPEQYAAIKFLGRKLYDPEGVENIEGNSLNHIEKLDMLEEKPDMREDIAKNFLKRAQSNSNMTELDKRIFDSTLRSLKGEDGKTNKSEDVLEHLEMGSPFSQSIQKLEGRVAGEKKK